MSVTVRYFAAARDAAGCAEEQAAAVPDLAALLAALVDRHGGARGDLARVLARCSFLLDGQRAARTALLPSEATVDVLPPFAGG